MDQLSNLGIDPWNMLLYLANTGVLLVILTYFLYKPILKFIDERRKTIEDSIEEANKLQQTFEAKLKESQEERAKVEAELKEELDNLHKFTDKKKAELIKEVEVMRTEMIQKTQKEIDQKKEELIKDAEAEVKRIMTQIILNIVENQVPEEVIQKSIKSSWTKYNK